jgi:D-beta-D-heptose 7-phosphate kinase/D-beta-D-heptose 1-phosphate adenosyltransferase
MVMTRPTPLQLASIVDRWRGRRMVVLGDVMLDDWRFTDARRLYREAPVPVLALRRQEDAAGGAANAAVNLAALGATPVLVAPLGDDEAGQRLRACLQRAGVDDATASVPGGRTSTKRRLVAADQILSCEEDASQRLDPPAAVVDRLLAQLDRLLTAGPVDLVICDYGLGTTGRRIRGWLAAHRDRLATVALDAHNLTGWTGLTPTVITPSLAEALPLVGTHPATDRVNLATQAAGELRRRLDAGNVAVTLDVDGAVVTGPSGEPYRTRTRPAPVSHTVGAGDAYLAAFALACAVGSDLPAAAELAQLAAAVTVHDVGTCVCHRADLAAAVRMRNRPHGAQVVDTAGLVEMVRRRRADGACVVFTNGCFDVLHSGHVGYLAEARDLGDLLIVAVNSDASVRRLKGPQRPVNAVHDRVAVLAALSCVDAVVVFEEDSPATLIEAVRPDIYVKGGDYPPELVPEAPLVRRLGGEVRTLGYVPDRSTSAIIDRIRARQPVPDRRPAH